MKEMKLKDKIREKNTLGTWITIDHQVVYEAVAQYDFDWVLIDLEHSAIDFSGLHKAISFFNKTEIGCLVRPPVIDNIYIKRIMDFGADGIVIPNVENSKDIESAVNFMKYPPKGSRGAGLFSAQDYGNNFDNYYTSSNSNSVLVVQIENKEAVKNLDDIVDNSSIDAILIGPYDLSSSLGLPGDFQNKLYIKEIEKIKKIANAKNISIGIHVIEPELKNLELAREQGFKFVGYGLDFKFITNHLLSLKKYKNVK